MTGSCRSGKALGALLMLGAMPASSNALASEPVAYVSLAEGPASIVRGPHRIPARPRVPLFASDALVVPRGSRVLACAAGGCRWVAGELRMKIGVPEQRPRALPARPVSLTPKSGFADAVRVIMDGPSDRAGRDDPFGP